MTNLHMEPARSLKNCLEKMGGIMKNMIDRWLLPLDKIHTKI